MAFNTRSPVIQAVPYTSEGDELSSVVSAKNSTDILLGADGVFIGDWEEITRFASISILVRADQVSAASGMEMQWSTNGVDIDEDDIFTIPANSGKFYTFPPVGRFLRVKFTNGSTPQGSFRLQTILRYTTVKPSSHRLDDAVIDEDDAELVKAVVTGRAADGTYKNLVINIDGRLELGESPASIGVAKIEDGAGSGRTVSVDSSNRLSVSANVIVPPTAVAVNVAETSSLTGTADSTYVIPAGKELTISRFAGGSEGNSGKVSKASLFYDPNGDGTGMTLIRVMYLGTSNWEFSLDSQFTGDGTAAIRLRRERLDGAADEVAGFWDGFRTA